MSEQTLPLANEGFGPNNGGDLILRSGDNADFNVHAIVLTINSPVFANMFQLATQNPIVQVAETSHLLGIMLNFMYHRPIAQITSFETLSSALGVADRYRVTGMTSQLRRELVTQSSPVSAFSDPVQALEVASLFGLAEEAKLASSLISERYNLRQVDDLLRLAQAMPLSAHAIKLVGLQSARMSILVDFLFDFENLQKYWVFSGSLCMRAGPFSLLKLHCSSTEWQIKWSCSAFRVLMSRPVTECEYIFKLGFLEVVMRPSPYDTPEPDCGCRKALLGSESPFESSVKLVRSELIERLKDLEKLDAI